MIRASAVVAPLPIWKAADLSEPTPSAEKTALESYVPPAKPSLDASMLRGMTVLIVDDNATNRTILKELAVKWEMKPRSQSTPASVDHRVAITSVIMESLSGLMHATRPMPRRPNPIPRSPGGPTFPHPALRSASLTTGS